MVHVDTPLYCDNCIHSHYEGEIMVGTDECGGGPEPAFSCKMGGNMTFYRYHSSSQCPKFDDGSYKEEDEEYFKDNERDNAKTMELYGNDDDD